MGTRTSGSEGGGGEITSRERGTAPRRRPYFSILERRLIEHGIFDSEADLATQMLAFVEHCNLTAEPFEWTYTGKVLVA